MRSHRITVIDDSREVLDVLGDALEREDIDVVLLGARATLEQIAASGPDVMMVDLRLGTDHLPGWELIRAARAHPSLAEVPIIVCSGALDQMRAYGGAAAASRTYLLPKPFSLDDLESVVADALSLTEAGVEPESAGPAAIQIGAIPDFARDPIAWFAWVEDELGGPRWRTLARSIEPATWISPLDHPWRLVRTARGVEVRPELVSPFLRYGNLPMVSALGFADEVEVELTTHQARWVDRFPCRTFDVPGLGAAMLDERKLPHDNLSQLFPPRNASPVETVAGGATSSRAGGIASRLR